MGASLVLVEMENARSNGEAIKFLFSGDLGHYDQPIVKDPDSPPIGRLCDGRINLRQSSARRSISIGRRNGEIINEAAKRNAPILIPAFAVGRTQEILYLIRELEDAKQNSRSARLVDSPMAAQATQVYGRWSEEHDEEYASILSRNAIRCEPVR